MILVLLSQVFGSVEELFEVAYFSIIDLRLYLPSAEKQFCRHPSQQDLVCLSPRQNVFDDRDLVFDLCSA